MPGHNKVQTTTTPSGPGGGSAEKPIILTIQKDKMDKLRSKMDEYRERIRTLEEVILPELKLENSKWREECNAVRLAAKEGKCDAVTLCGVRGEMASLMKACTQVRSVVKETYDDLSSAGASKPPVKEFAVEVLKNHCKKMQQDINILNRKLLESQQDIVRRDEEWTNLVTKLMENCLPATTEKVGLVEKPGCGDSEVEVVEGPPIGGEDSNLPAGGAALGAALARAASCSSWTAAGAKRTYEDMSKDASTPVPRPVASGGSTVPEHDEYFEHFWTQD